MLKSGYHILNSSIPTVPTCPKFFSIMIPNPFPKFFSTLVPTLQDHELELTTQCLSVTIFHIQCPHGSILALYIAHIC